MQKIAPSDSTVLITGETGVGKELIARAIHAASPRRAQALVKVNCSAIPETLAESELFGYERGAFTGAVTSKPGRFELAHGGTIFLDEIGDMPLQLQSRLLGVLQDRTFERVGGVRSITVNVRVIAATNRNLQADVQAGTFRADLFYRLNVVPIHVPALRERREDILPLAEHFLVKFKTRHGKLSRRLAPESAAALAGHDWPGNIRELENAMERLVLMSESETIGLAEVPPEIGGGVSLRLAATFKERREDIAGAAEKQMISDALAATSRNRTKAAALLGISRRSLQMKIKGYGI